MKTAYAAAYSRRALAADDAPHTLPAYRIKYVTGHNTIVIEKRA